jgi:hypothetical protein
MPEPILDHLADNFLDPSCQLFLINKRLKSSTIENRNLPQRRQPKIPHPRREPHPDSNSHTKDRADPVSIDESLDCGLAEIEDFASDHFGGKGQVDLVGLA